MYSSARQHVCVVGSGCAGLAAAHALAKAGCRVLLLEAASHLGGHAETLSVEGVPVDVGFMVYNRVTYPNMARLPAHFARGYPWADEAARPWPWTGV